MRILLLCFAAVIAVSTQADLLVVANRGSSSVTLVDPHTMQRITQIDAGPQPHEVAVSHDHKLAYVSNYVNATGTTLTVIDLVARTKLKTISIAPLTGPHGIIQRDGRIWFTAEKSNAVARYDPVTDRVDWIGLTNQVGTHMLAVRSDSKVVYTANVGSHTASIIDVSGAESISRKTIPTVANGEGIALSPDGRELWVGSASTGGIAIIDLLTESRVATISPGTFNYRLTFTHDGRRVLVPRHEQRAIAVYDALARQEIRTVPMIGRPLGILVSPDSRYAFIGMTDPDLVVKLDLQTYEVVRLVQAGAVPDGLAYALDPNPPPARRRRSARSW